MPHVKIIINEISYTLINIDTQLFKGYKKCTFERLFVK